MPSWMLLTIADTLLKCLSPCCNSSHRIHAALLRPPTAGPGGCHRQDCRRQQGGLPRRHGARRTLIEGPQWRAASAGSCAAASGDLGAVAVAALRECICTVPAHQLWGTAAVLTLALGLPLIPPACRATPWSAACSTSLRSRSTAPWQVRGWGLGPPGQRRTGSTGGRMAVAGEREGMTHAQHGHPHVPSCTGHVVPTSHVQASTTTARPAAP